MTGMELAGLCARHLEGRVAAISFQSVGELWYGAIKAGGESVRHGRPLDSGYGKAP